MKKNKLNKKEIYLKFIGVIFVIWGLASFLHALTITHPSEILWLSYIGITLSGIAILFKKTQLLLSQIYILLIPNIFWNMDFFWQLITGNNLLGIADYVFTDRLLFSQIISFQHLAIIPLSLIALYILKTKNFNYWKISLLQITIVLTLSRIFSNPQVNVNYVFNTNLFTLGLPAFIETFAATTLMIFLSIILISKIPYFQKIIKTA